LEHWNKVVAKKALHDALFQLKIEINAFFCPNVLEAVKADMAVFLKNIPQHPEASSGKVHIPKVVCINHWLLFHVRHGAGGVR
jgi:hypothetical protein